jgi:putative hydrolase
VASEPADFFRGIFGDLLKMLRTESPVQWELAGQLARSVAAGDDPEPNVEPTERVRFSELAQIAELYVADVAGMATGAIGEVEIVPVGRVDWAARSLEAWRPFINELAASLGPPRTEAGTSEEAPPDSFDEEPNEGEAFADLIGEWASVMTPAMVAMQVGSIVGNLARKTFGQHELPLPRQKLDEVLVIPDNVAAFAEDWSLPPDDVRMWVCLTASAYHAVLSRPHVRDRLEALLLEHARGFRPDPRAMEKKLGDIDPTDFPQLTRMLGDPSALGMVLDSPEIQATRARLAALTATIAGFVEHVATTAGARLIGSHAALREALRRRRVERDDGDKGVESLFGIRIDQELVDRGLAFMSGVLERGGEAELAKLWVVEGNLPTPAEVDAPGLWIERVNLPPMEDEPAAGGGEQRGGEPSGGPAPAGGGEQPAGGESSSGGDQAGGPPGGGEPPGGAADAGGAGGPAPEG